MPSPGPGAPPRTPVIPNRYHVQVGAFAEHQNADAIALRIRSMGYAVAITDGPPYRVWVGGYLNQATAERLAANLRAAGFDVILTPR